MITQAEIEAERERQKQMRTCVCGGQKASGFKAVCDRCWHALPWALRRPLVKLSLHTPDGQAAQGAAEAWLKNHLSRG